MNRFLTVVLAAMMLTACNPTPALPLVMTASAPASGMTGIGINTSIVLTFSKAMNPASVFVTPIPATVLNTPVWSSGNTKLTLTPSVNLAINTLYAFSIKANAADGSILAGNTALQFSTGSDAVMPKLISSSPAHGATNISIYPSLLRFHFDEAMNAQFTISNIDIPNIEQLATLGVWDVDRTTLSFNLDYSNISFLNNKRYEFLLSVSDVVGNPLVASVAFTTEPDLVKPQVRNVTPYHHQQVLVNSHFKISFNEAMNETFFKDAISFSPAVTCAWVLVGNEFDCTPSVPLQYGTTYMVMVATTAKDVAGNPLAAAFEMTFSTDLEYPKITKAVPRDGSMSVSTTAKLILTFSMPMDKVAVESALSIKVAGVPKSGALTWNAGCTTISGTCTELTFTPTTAYGTGTAVSWEMNTSAKNFAGNAYLYEKVTAGFQTEFVFASN